jgi:uncharacterized protein YegL
MKSKKTATRKFGKDIEIVVLLDRSGSMEAVRSDMVGGLNRYVDEQKENVPKAKFTLAQFDTQYELLLDGVAIKTVGKLDLVPRGCTALLDAIGRTIIATKDRLSKIKTIPRLLFVIITDGHENSSHEFTKKQILEMIKQQQADKWEFVFLGANQDAIDEGSQIGIGVSQSMTYQPTQKGISSAYKSLSRATMCYCSGGDFNFTTTDRSAQDET